MCLFFFLLCEKKFTSRKKSCSEVVQWKSNCGWWGGNMNEGLLMKLGVTVSCFVMHFSFDQYYYQCKKKKGKEFKGSPELQSWIWDPEASMRPLCLPFTRSLFCLCCGSFSCVFGGEMSLLNQVVWAGACVRLNKPAPWWADFDPISNICPLTLVERMPSYANFYTGSVEPF